MNVVLKSPECKNVMTAAAAETTRSLSGYAAVAVVRVRVRPPNDMKIDPSGHGLIKYS